MRAPRRIPLLALLLLLPAPPPALAADAPLPPQPLVQLLQLAETRHSDFLAQKSAAAAAAEDAPIARADLLPQASASLTGNRGQDDNDSWSAGLSVNQALFNLPRQRLVQAAEERAKTANLNLAAARQNLRRDVIVAWLDVQLAAEVLRLVEARRKTLREQLKRAEALAASGQVIEADVLSARAGLANARAQWEQSRHDLAVARAAIARYTSAAAADMRLAAGFNLPPLPPLAEWQQQTEERNLPLQAARSETAAIRRRLQAATASVYPRLTLNGALTARDGLDNAEDSWQLMLTQNLYTGGNLRAQQRQLIAESDAAHERVAAVIAQNRQTIDTLHGQMRADRARIGALTDAAEAADALLQVVIIGYDNGVNIAADVLGAEEDLFDARLNLRQAAYSYLKTLAAAQTLTASGDDAFAMQIETLFIPADKE